MGARWPQGQAGDISLPTPTCAAGETEARADFPSSLGHRCALCTPGLCRWVPGHPRSEAQQGHACGHTGMHSHRHACAHTHTRTHTCTHTDPLRASPQRLTRLGQPHLPAPTSAPAPDHLGVRSKPRRNWGSSTQRWGAGGPGAGAMHPGLVTQAFGYNRGPKLSPSTQTTIPIVVGWGRAPSRSLGAGTASQVTPSLAPSGAAGPGDVLLPR